MPRQARVAPGGLIYHVLNRGAGRQMLFEDDADYAAFLRAMDDVLRDDPIRVLGYCLMGNHWHLVLWPQRDGQLARFMQRLTITHVQRDLRRREQRDRLGLARRIGQSSNLILPDRAQRVGVAVDVFQVPIAQLAGPGDQLRVEIHLGLRRAFALGLLDGNLRRRDRRRCG
jgi:REP element-mobilizing transposase RayT